VECRSKLVLKFTGAKKLYASQCRSKQVRKCSQHGIFARSLNHRFTGTLVVLVKNVILSTMEVVVKFCGLSSSTTFFHIVS